MKRTLKILGLTLLTILLLLVTFLFIDPELPEQTDEVIAQLTRQAIPELVDGETGHALSGSTKIWYEIKNPPTPAKGSILLINGFTQPSTHWNRSLVQTLLNEGYQVIKFDNREVGYSDWTKSEDSETTYSIDDMVNDALAVLDKNGIDKAHLIGYSMGGNIAQRIAIHHPQKVSSLTCLSSTGDFSDDHPEFTGMPVLKLFIRNSIMNNDESYLKFYFKLLECINGYDDANIDLQLFGEEGLYELHNRKGYNPDAAKYQGAAIEKANSLYDQLDKINTPTLIVHGTKDPILSFELAKKYSEKIENSKEIWIDGAGHLISNHFVEHFRETLLKMLAESQQE